MLATAAAVAPPLALLAHKGLAPLFVLAAVAVLATGLVRRRTAVPTGLGTAALAGLGGLALLSALWSRTPGASLQAGVSLAGTLFGAAVLVGAARRLPAAERDRVRRGLMLGGLLGAAALWVETLGDGILHRLLADLQGKPALLPGHAVAALIPGTAVFALSLWAWVGALAGRLAWPVALGLGLAGMAGIFIGGAEAVMLAVAAGGAVAATVWLWPRRTPMLLATAMVLAVAAAPWVVRALPSPVDSDMASWPNSALHRLMIWKTADRHIFERPLAGHGFDASRSLYGKDDKVLQVYGYDIRSRQMKATYFEPIPLHPHNAVLQVWLELGALGAAALAALLFAVVRGAAGLSPARRPRALALGGVTAGVCVAALSFGAWQSWWVCGLALLAAISTAVFSDAGTRAADGRCR